MRARSFEVLGSLWFAQHCGFWVGLRSDPCSDAKTPAEVAGASFPRPGLPRVRAVSGYASRWSALSTRPLRRPDRFWVTGAWANVRSQSERDFGLLQVGAEGPHQ